MMTATETSDVTAGLVPSNQLLGTSDLARMFRVLPHTVGQWAKAGKLPKPIRIGRSPFWTPAQIKALLGVDDASGPHGAA